MRLRVCGAYVLVFDAAVTTPPQESVAEPTPGRVFLLERLAAWFMRFAERFVPEAYVFALLGTVLVTLGALAHGSSPSAIADAWGGTFWELLPFTLQMALIVITGHVLASAGPIAALVRRLATVPRSARDAVAFVGFVAMVASWFNWGFSLVFAALLAKRIAARLPRVDYRTLAAASFMGLGSVWAQGLSGSAALQVATPSALPPAIRQVIAEGGHVKDGLLPFSHTIFLWQSLLSVGIEIVVVTTLLYFAAPNESRAKSAHDLGISLEDEASPGADADRGLENSQALSLAVFALGAFYVARVLLRAPQLASALSLNLLNLVFLLLGILFHRTPARLSRAFRQATPAVWGILLQYPFYAGIAGILTQSGLSDWIARGFVSISTRLTLPALVSMYSTVLGVFVPSGGSKWVIEAPYVLGAAHRAQVHLGWMVAVYDLGEALANLVQPFWMLPILGLFGLKAKDVMGMTTLVFLVLLPLVLVLVTVLGATLPYPL